MSFLQLNISFSKKCGLSFILAHFLIFTLFNFYVEGSLTLTALGPPKIKLSPVKG